MITCGTLGTHYNSDTTPMKLYLVALCVASLAAGCSSQPLGENTSPRAPPPHHTLAELVQSLLKEKLSTDSKENLKRLRHTQVVQIVPLRGTNEHAALNEFQKQKKRVVEITPLHSEKLGGKTLAYILTTADDNDDETNEKTQESQSIEDIAKQIKAYSDEIVAEIDPKLDSEPVQQTENDHQSYELSSELAANIAETNSSENTESEWNKGPHNEFYQNSETDINISTENSDAITSYSDEIISKEKAESATLDTKEEKSKEISIERVTENFMASEETNLPFVHDNLLTDASNQQTILQPENHMNQSEDYSDSKPQNDIDIRSNENTNLISEIDSSSNLASVSEQKFQDDIFSSGTESWPIFTNDLYKLMKAGKSFDQLNKSYEFSSDSSVSEGIPFESSTEEYVTEGPTMINTLNLEEISENSDASILQEIPLAKSNENTEASQLFSNNEIKVLHTDLNTYIKDNKRTVDLNQYKTDTPDKTEVFILDSHIEDNANIMTEPEEVLRLPRDCPCSQPTAKTTPEHKSYHISLFFNK